jgi:di/tricarboxylate transporter
VLQRFGPQVEPLLEGVGLTKGEWGNHRFVFVSGEAWFTLGVALVTIGLLAADRYSAVLVMGGALVTLFVVGIIDEDQAFGGFSNEAPITVAALYVLTGAADATGALEGHITRILGSGRRQRPRRDLARVCFPSSAMSAFIANTPLVAMLAPRVTSWARRNGNPPSRYLMPLSYAVIFGGCITLIGTSTNLFVSDLMEDAGQRPVGLFEITPVGLPLAVVGVCLIVLLAPKLLVERGTLVDDLAAHTRDFTVEMMVVPGSAIAGKTITEAHLRNLEGVFLVEAERDGQALAPVGPDHRLEAGDRLTFAGNLDRLIDLQRVPGLVSTEERHFAPADGQSSRNFYEAVVGASSELVGVTLKDVGFRSRYGAAVVAIHRAGERINAKLGAVRLRPGDVLLVIGGTDFHERFRDQRDFALIAPLRRMKPVRREHARVVELAILGLIVTAGTGLLDLLQVSLVLAFGLVAFRVISPSEARRAVDFDVIMLMGTSFGLASAVAASGLAKEIANVLVHVSEPLGDLGILAGILITTMLMTELLSNNAAAALMFPIAMATAQQSGLDPRPFAMVILFGATLSFLTPIGYQSNTLVWSMGGYRYGDFARLGAPLTAAVIVVTVLLVPVFFPL